MDELIQEFLVESNENLDRYEGDLVKLEADPGSKELLSSIFRSIHSIKGACGFLGFQKLEKLAHAGENLLSKLRDGQLELTAEIGSALLEAGDRIRQMLAAIGETGADGEEESQELIERLKRLQQEPSATPRGEVRATGDEPRPAAKAEAEPEPAAAGEERAPEAPEVIEARSGTGAGEAQGVSEQSRAKVGAIDSTIRVNVTVLDRLMTLVGELVLARNQLLQFANTVSDTGFHAISQHMNLIATELQEEVMKTRMQPIGNIWSKFPRTVRDLVVSCGKEVRIEMEGKETEHGAPIYRLRGRLLPLLYLRRELGLASREEVEPAAVNIVVLRVDSRQFGLVVDEINDTEEIVVKPLRKELKNVKAFAGASIMGDGRVALILDVPGLAQRANLGAQGGEGRKASEEGKTTEGQSGARQTLLLFESGGKNRMAIPLSAVARLEEFARDQVERSGGQEVVQYRGQILPLIRAGGVASYGDFKGEGEAKSAPLEVVVYSERGRSVGLVVDHILDIVEESVVMQHAGEGAGMLGAAVVQQKVTELLDVAGVVRAAHLNLSEERG